MIEDGVPLKVVSDVLGHFSVSTTGDTYGQVSPDVSARRWMHSEPRSMGNGGQQWWS